jgi:hypothetical protein
MFPNSESITRSIVGAWKIFRWDAAGLDEFDLTNKGFWQSFMVPIVLAPTYLFLLMQIQKMALAVDLGNAGLAADTEVFSSAFLVYEMVRYILGFALFPLVMVFLTRLAGLTDKYAPLIITYNWTSGLLLTAMFATSVLFFLRVFSLAVTSSFLLVFMLVWPFYLFSGVRISTGASIGVAIGFVIVDILIQQLLVYTQALF